MDTNNPTIMVAVISSAVSIVTVFISFFLKSWFEKHFFAFKLEEEHRYDQKKKIKETIAKHKTHLLDAAETLNHRLWNFADNYENKWHTTSNISVISDHYYLPSFTYRMLTFFAWIRKTEAEMVFLDTTIASPDDLDFVKYLRMMTPMMCDVELFNGLEYDSNNPTDHFFRDDFVHMCESFHQGSGVVSYADFKANKDGSLDEAMPMTQFINGMNPNEDRLRWDRLQAFHYVLLMFLNSYGYDFQKTDQTKMQTLLAKWPRRIKVADNLRSMLDRIHLGRHKETKRILAAI